ncbi:phosphohistidine phosphatase SixA [Gammaproteobacteria bacterium 53_120_T64]|nr:phosphohistidine phosphatase SixA [Gammaproteobacteria bacterium 53_120_T64]
MELFFLRHGEAEAYAASDAERRLTATGEEAVRGVIDARREALAGVELIVTSPYRRARQTAQIAAHCLDFERELLVTEHLQPGGDRQGLFRFIETLQANSILLVTHQPFVGKVLSLLSGDKQWLATGTANLVALQAEALVPGFADVRWAQLPLTE